MPKNSIGDFFVTIASVIDKASFDTSNRLVDNLGNSFNKLIGSAVNAANTLATTALDTAKMGDSAYKMSEAWGIATDALNLWRATAKIATSDAKSLDNALGKLADVKNGMKFGEGFNAFAEQLAKLGMGYNELDNLSPDKQLEAIINHALTKSNLSKTETAKVLEGLLGTGASQLYLKLSEKGITDVGAYQRSEVQPRIFTDNQDFLNLAGFQEEVNKFDQAIDSFGTLLGSTLAKNLTEPLSSLNDWLVAHGDEIKDAMDKLGTAIADILVETGKTAVTAGSVVDAGTDLVDFFTAETPEEKQEAFEKLEDAVESWENPSEDAGLLATGIGYVARGTDIVTDKIVDTWNKVKDKKAAKKLLKELKAANNGELLTIGEDIDLGDVITAKKLLGEKTVGKYVQLQDGIMRPDGTVAQVAPDDWVFAARNIGDMARAFIPQNYQSVSAPSEYNIVQNFTINGASDIPQVLRQQAYQGTQDAMLQLMQQSSQRLQLMSGTR